MRAAKTATSSLNGRRIDALDDTVELRQPGFGGLGLSGEHVDVDPLGFACVLRRVVRRRAGQARTLDDGAEGEIHQRFVPGSVSDNTRRRGLLSGKMRSALNPFLGGVRAVRLHGGVDSDRLRGVGLHVDHRGGSRRPRQSIPRPT